MRICEHNFEREDPEAPGYSQHEVDYYAWTPQGKHKEIPNHRLSLRKNLGTSEYEFCRVYHRGTTPQQVKAGRTEVVTMILSKSSIVEIAFKTKDFYEALTWGNKEWNRWHEKDDYTREADEPCTHGEGMYGTTAMFCAKLRQRT